MIISFQLINGLIEVIELLSVNNWRNKFVQVYIKNKRCYTCTFFNSRYQLKLFVTHILNHNLICN
jgi:hypothetical protein